MIEVTVSGVRLHVEDVGQGPPVLLLHAFPLRGAMWRPQLEALADGHRLIAPDTRGLGGSSLPAGGYTLDQAAGDMLGLLDALGIGRAVVCGLSMGGYIAFALYRRAPERVRALILADTRPQADGEEGRQARQAGARLAREQGATAVAEAMLPRLLAPATLAGRPAVVEAVRGMILANDPEGIAAAQEAMVARLDATDLLPQIGVPTLALAGSADAVTPPEVLRAMAEAIPGARAVEIAGAGHLSNLEQPEAFNAELRAFLARLAA
jgi:3-oxoadipate enol-lactonase